MFDWLKQLFGGSSESETLGGRGESIAAKHLRNAGFRIIARNFRCPVGEVDLIARDGKTLVFVEVKTRAYDQAEPDQAVQRTKQHQLIKAALVYISRYGEAPPPSRFDVISIVWPKGHSPQIEHMKDAFDATGHRLG